MSTRLDFRPTIERAEEVAGSRAKLADLLGVSKRTVDGWVWKGLPVDRVREVVEIADQWRPPLLPDPAEVARRTGFTERAVASWFGGRRSPRLVDLDRVLDAFPDLRRRAGKVIETMAKRYRDRHPQRGRALIDVLSDDPAD